jgi:hypothetical protein
MFNLNTQSLNNGFTMTFENGYTVSVAWGWGNYCDSRHKHLVSFGPTDRLPSYSSTEFYECKTAEVAVWNRDGTFLTPDGKLGGDVLPYRTPEEVASFLSEVASWKSNKEFNNEPTNQGTMG